MFVKKWGNSASVRIPAPVMQAARLSLVQAVEIREEQGRVVIKQILPDTCDIGALVSGIEDDNLHDEIETGAPVGREVW